MAGAVLLLNFQPYNWGRVDWGADYLSAAPKKFRDPNNTMVLMLGNAPTSYVIPSFPGQVRFLRMEGNLITRTETGGFAAIIKEEVSMHKGDIFILFEQNDSSVNIESSLSRMELKLDNSKCFELQTNIPDTIMMCQVHK